MSFFPHKPLAMTWGSAHERVVSRCPGPHDPRATRIRCLVTPDRRTLAGAGGGGAAGRRAKRRWSLRAALRAGCGRRAGGDVSTTPAAFSARVALRWSAQRIQPQSPHRAAAIRLLEKKIQVAQAIHRSRANQARPRSGGLYLCDDAALAVDGDRRRPPAARRAPLFVAGGMPWLSFQLSQRSGAFQ